MDISFIFKYKKESQLTDPYKMYVEEGG